MTAYVGVDPGPTHSAYVVTDFDRRPWHIGKLPNDELLAKLPELVEIAPPTHVGIEWISSYGMPVGAEVFDTCLWVGRYCERLTAAPTDCTCSSWPCLFVGRYCERLIRDGCQLTVRLCPRPDVKRHHTGSRTAKDANVSAALIERFAPGEPNRGKGTKAAPGWFHGFAADIWQAYAVAVYLADMAEPVPTADDRQPRTITHAELHAVSLDTTPGPMSSGLTVRWP